MVKSLKVNVKRKNILNEVSYERRPRAGKMPGLNEDETFSFVIGLWPLLNVDSRLHGNDTLFSFRHSGRAKRDPESRDFMKFHKRRCIADPTGVCGRSEAYMTYAAEAF